MEPPSARVTALGLPAPRASGAVTPRVAGAHKWRFATPQGRYAAVCVTCVGTIEAKRPRIQAGNIHARNYHCACVASKLPADIAQVEGWDTLSHIAKVQVRGELSTAAAKPSPLVPASRESPEPVPPGAAYRLQNIHVWRHVDWMDLHARATLIRHVPQACRAPVADLRAAIADALHDPDLQGADADSEDLWNLFFFLNMLLFSPTAARAGRKGQHAEKPLAAITRRLQAAWEGKWLLLLAEAQQRASDPTRPASAPTLASEVRAIQQALQEDDVRMAVRRLDGSAALASPAKAARCLRRLHPDPLQVPRYPTPPCPPPAESLREFEAALDQAVARAPHRRGAGHGNAPAELWTWMPAHSHAWPQVRTVLRDLALGKAPQPVLEAYMSTRLIALERDHPEKVRPLGLGNLFRKLINRAKARMLAPAVSEALAPLQFAIGHQTTGGSP